MAEKKLQSLAQNIVTVDTKLKKNKDVFQGKQVTFDIQCRTTK